MEFTFPEVSYLLIFLGVIIIDLGGRWMAFGRVESIAIDVALFSGLFSLHNLMLSEAEPKIWLFRMFSGIIVLGALIAFHSYLRNRLEIHVNNLFLRLINNAKDANLAKLIGVEQVMAKWSIDLALWDNKYGKKERRKKIIDVLHKTGLDTENDLADKDLLLPPGLRRLSILIFILLGAFSLVIPLITIK